MEQRKSSSKQETKENLIIINKMYVGGYLTEGENIGHEIINLYRADDGCNYIHLNAQGIIDKKWYEYKNKIILLTRPYGQNLLKVIAKAVVVETLECAKAERSKKDRYKEQIRLNIEYGEVSLIDIFKANTFHGILEQDVHTTFKVKEILKPQNPLFITDVKNKENEKDIFFIPTNLKEKNDSQNIEPKDQYKGFGKTSLRLFFKQNDKDNKAFISLNNMISNHSLWETEDKTIKVEKPTSYLPDSTFNILKLIRFEDSELAFSNMLFYFLNNPNVFYQFANEVLEIKGVTQLDKYTVTREERNTDLLITTSKYVIILENKIKSDVNGKECDLSKQIKDIWNKNGKNYKAIKKALADRKDPKAKCCDELFEKEKKNLETIIKQSTDKGKKTSQLAKYYIYAKRKAFDLWLESDTSVQDYDKFKVFGYIFSPKYKQIPQDYLNQYILSEKYDEPKYYDKLLSFFKKEEFDSIPYITDFRCALTKHAKEIDNDLEGEMDRRFKNAIFRALQEKKENQ